MSADWINELLGGFPPDEGETVSRRGRSLTGLHGLVRDIAIVEGEQAQTRHMFAFKWDKRRTTHGSPAATAVAICSRIGTTREDTGGSYSTPLAVPDFRPF